MAALQSSTLAKNAAKLAAQLALVESRGREKSDSRPSTGTAVSAAGDSVKDSMQTSWAPSQATTGHTSPSKLEDSSPTSWATSRATTGRTSPTKIEDTETTQEPQDPYSIVEEDVSTIYLTGCAAEEDNLLGATSTDPRVLCYSVAEAVEAFEAKITKTKKKKRISTSTRALRTWGWRGYLMVGVLLFSLLAVICSYHYISECIIIIKVKQ